MAYTVKAVADMTGITVRTLHYYDQIGLLRPAAVSPAGYRLYADADLVRLQQILFFRELGFSLQEIKTILDSPDFDPCEALRQHRRALLERQERLQRLIQTVDRTLERMEGEMKMGKDEIKELFDGFDPSEHEEEARQRWGGSREFAESVERTRRYRKEDWTAIQAEAAEIYQNLAARMDRRPDDPEVQAWTGRWHQHINKWYYTCSPEVFRGLGELYVADERFTKNIDKTKPGLAAFMKEAMAVYADRLEAQQ